MRAGLLLLLGAGVGAFFLLAPKKSNAATDPDLESKMIGTELAALPEASRTAIFRLLLANDPADDAGVYVGAIAQLTQLGTFPFTVNKLTQRAKDRFG